jgi:hypothetical protein
MLEKEFQFFKEHQNELVKKHLGKILAIVGDRVLGAYASYAEAYTETVKTHKPGTFMLQECIPGPEAYTVTITSNLIVAAQA